MTIIYGVKPTGELIWYRHKTEGEWDWDPPGGKFLNSGWSMFNHIFYHENDFHIYFMFIHSEGYTLTRSMLCSPGNGVIYGVTPAGQLMWYRHLDFMTGGPLWENNGVGKTLKSDFGGVFTLFCTAAGKDCIIYTQQKDGTVKWWKHKGYLNGTKSFEGPNTIASWGGLIPFAGRNGVIYGVMNPGGQLKWYKHTGYETGTTTGLDHRDEKEIGTQWDAYMGAAPYGGNIFNRIFCGIDGDIYAIAGDGTLMWYKHNGFDTGTDDWANNKKGKPIGTGWDALSIAFTSPPSFIPI